MFKILIVDDDPEVRGLLTGMVSRLGYEVRVAVDGMEGEALTFEWQPDIILMDSMMPFQDGHDTCIRLRKRGFGGRILLMSALSNIMTRFGGIEDALQCGADGFLAKPISSQELRKTLNWHLHLGV